MMKKKLLLIGAGVLALAALLFGTALAAAIDPTARTVTTSALFVDWDETNPEAIFDIRWNGSGNLTGSAVVPPCPDALEYFGNAWANHDEGTPDFVFVSLVGWGSAGDWAAQGSKGVNINSSSNGCLGSAGIPVETRYKFWDNGAVVNRFRVHRTFSFGGTPFTESFRPYMPRLSPMSAYAQVLHPDAAGTALLTEDSTVCDFGCQVSDWDESWYAIHDPATGRGLIVRRESSLPADLWVDQDTASDSNSSSALLIAPPGGFTGDVVEKEFLCFYDSGTWTPSLSLPPGC